MLISIDGPIGAGKSTLVAQLASQYSVFVEPIQAWTLLEDFVKDLKTHAFAFQVEILISYYKMLKNISKDRLVVVERSPWSSNRVFFDMYIDCPLQKKVYQDLYDKYGKLFEPDLIIFLDVDAETSWSRVVSRGRREEHGYTREHITKVVERYKMAMLHTSIPVKTLSDCSSYHSDAVNIIENAVKNILQC